MVSRFLFSLSLFLSALLLFSIQPMVARALLPIYGGTPAVWTVCMLFFQLILLIAYGYSVFLSCWKHPWGWRSAHTILVVFSLVSMPILFKPFIISGNPEWGILYNLLRQLGIPLLVLGASAPLLQFAYSQTQGHRASDPYFLYIASNIGSLCALLFYPGVVEQYIGLKNQFYWWDVGYIIYVVLLLFLFYRYQYSSLLTTKLSASWPWRKMAYWVFLSFIPCSLMLGVTLHITTDVAATPFFWIIPLGLYLVTFILTFTAKSLFPFAWLAQNGIAFLALTILGFILNVSLMHAWEAISFHLVSFFILSLLCHRQLFLCRPKPELLTLFYFCLALGGVLAGLFNGVVAPHWFNQVYEYPLTLLFTLFAIPIRQSKPKSWWVLLIIPALVFFILFNRSLLPNVHWPINFTSLQISVILVLIMLAVWQHSRTSLFLSLFILFGFIFSPLLQDDKILLQERNFYGVKKVIDKGVVHALISQSTVHGLQLDTQKSNGFTSYYGAIKPIIERLQQEWDAMSVTVVGLGVGTMACQFRQQDQLRFIEIDEQVIQLAKNKNLFTYLQDCLPQVTLIKNDGRLALQQLEEQSQSLLIIDAFNSDAIPMHLLTQEAFTLYKQKIMWDGAILINLSNRYVDLLPVITAAGRSLDLMVFAISHPGNAASGQFASQWALLTMNDNLGLKIMQDTHWHFVANEKEFLWTDDYSNVLSLLK